MTIVAALMLIFIDDIRMSGTVPNAITGISHPLNAKTAMKKNEFTEMIKRKFVEPVSQK